MINYLKKTIRKILSNPKTNLIILALLKLISPLIPNNIVSRIPVYGRININLSKNRNFYMLSEGDDEIASRLYFKGIHGYEYQTTKFILKYLKIIRGIKVFFDIGANTGFYSLLVAREFSDAHVYAFEPYPRAYNRMRENINLNKLSNISLFPYAIDEHSGKVLFSNMDTHLGINTTNQIIQIVKKNQNAILVKTVSIDDFVRKFNIEALHIIKIDVEGNFLNVLMGGKDTFLKLRPVIICEINDTDISEFIYRIKYKILGKKDFRNIILMPEEIIDIF